MNKYDLITDPEHGRQIYPRPYKRYPEVCVCTCICLSVCVYVVIQYAHRNSGLFILVNRKQQCIFLTRNMVNSFMQLIK